MCGLAAGIGDWGFCTAEKRDADIAAEVEGVWISELEGGFVGLAGERVVDVAASGMVAGGGKA